LRAICRHASWETLIHPHGTLGELVSYVEGSAWGNVLFFLPHLMWTNWHMSSSADLPVRLTLQQGRRITKELSSRLQFPGCLVVSHKRRQPILRRFLPSWPGGVRDRGIDQANFRSHRDLHILSACFTHVIQEVPVGTHPATIFVDQPIDPFGSRPAYTAFLHVCIRARPAAPLASSLFNRPQWKNTSCSPAV
jgi:hypothetical protein